MHWHRCSTVNQRNLTRINIKCDRRCYAKNIMGKNLAQEECNRPSQFPATDFNMVKILSVSFNKGCPLAPSYQKAELQNKAC